ncbi:MAG TPA: AAA family ATPase [Sulfuricurvum sp.]|nr:MAG: AAA family ATPase [Campylobacterales bacterium 16-40-21]OZA02093.1 MAG: AAA family ATPase [Sulfuricurvum sp. 17-40-25]HQS67748.1 AAA family ATPase [Sulfuricurvum sp.]HQT37465.1 AAA family ATPase [Sulfuricurvum sp.]
MINTLQNAKRLSLLKLHQALPDYKRFLYEDLLESSSKITGVYGSRGVGKTTLLLQVLKALPLEDEKKLYISCDHPIFKNTSLFDFIDEFSKRGGELIVIDEIHEAHDFQAQLKSVYDFLDIKVFFSGSSAIKITNADFARRYSMYHLPILSFREYLEISQNISLPKYELSVLLTDHETIVHSIMNILIEKKILKFYDLFIDNGVYPFYFEDKNKYIDRIQETINTILHTDLGQLFSIQPDKIDTLKKLLLTICVSQPLEMTVDKLASTVGITKATLYKYIDYLGRAELIHHITHEAKRFNALRKPDKLYLGNTNLFNALCMDNEKGTVRETFFVSQLSAIHTLHYLDRGDFLVDEKYVFEVGGKNKGFDQIKNIPDSYIAADDIEIGIGNKIPLWLFGFLY